MGTIMKALGSRWTEHKAARLQGGAQLPAQADVSPRRLSADLERCAVAAPSSDTQFLRDQGTSSAAL